MRRAATNRFRAIELRIELAVEIVGLIGENCAEWTAGGGKASVTAIDVFAISNRRRTRQRSQRRINLSSSSSVTEDDDEDEEEDYVNVNPIQPYCNDSNGTSSPPLAVDIPSR